MTAPKLDELEAILDAIEAHLRILQEHDYGETAFLLGLVQLDLRMRLYGISSGELKVYSDLLRDYSTRDG